MTPSKARILVVEDDPAILRGVLDVLVFNGFEACGIEDGSKGLEEGLNAHYDLMILDVMLPGTDGFTICRQVRKAKPSQPIVMLTAKGSEDDIVNGFGCGADDYISKPFSIRELMVRIEALLRRAGKLTAGERITLMDICFDPNTLKAGFRGKTIELTRREMDIIVWMYHHQDRIVSKKELLSHVWNYTDTGIETRTVDIHILKLRKKIIALTDGLPLITTIRGQGYRLETQP